MAPDCERLAYFETVDSVQTKPSYSLMIQRAFPHVCTKGPLHGDCAKPATEISYAQLVVFRRLNYLEGRCYADRKVGR